MSFGLPAKHWTNPAKSGWAEVGAKKSSVSLSWVVVDSLFLFVYDSDESLSPSASHSLPQSHCRVAKSSEVASGGRGLVVTIGKENLILQVETDEEQAEWISAIELQQRKVPSPKVPSPKMPIKAPKPKPASKDAQLARQDKKAFDDISSEGHTNSEYITHVTKNRARPPRKAPPSRKLMHMQAEESETTMYTTDTKEIEAMRAENERSAPVAAAAPKAGKPRAVPRQPSSKQVGAVTPKPQPPIAAKRKPAGKATAVENRPISVDLADDLGFEMIDDEDEDMLAMMANKPAATEKTTGKPDGTEKPAGKPAATEKPSGKPDATEKPAAARPAGLEPTPKATRVAPTAPGAGLAKVMTSAAPVKRKEPSPSPEPKKPPTPTSEPTARPVELTPALEAVPAADRPVDEVPATVSQGDASSADAATVTKSAADSTSAAATADPEVAFVRKGQSDCSFSSSGSSMEMAAATTTSNVREATSSTVENHAISKGDFGNQSLESVPTAEFRAEVVAIMNERQEVAVTLHKAMEILRQAKVARDQALQDLADAERRKLEADAAKKQALEILRMAREAVKQLK